MLQTQRRNLVYCKATVQMLTVEWRYIDRDEEFLWEIKSYGRYKNQTHMEMWRFSTHMH